MTASSIEIIVPTYNRPDSIVEMFESVLIQTIFPKRVTIVDAGSNSANYAPFIKRFEECRIELRILKSTPGLTYQRNLGMKDAYCDIVLFLDDDVVLNPDYIEVLLQAFDSSVMIGGVTGRILNTNIKQSIITDLFRKVFYLNRVRDGRILASGFPTGIKQTSDAKVDILSGSNMAYRLEVIKSFQFDELLSKYAYMEDIDYSYRVSLKYGLLYVHNAGLFHNTAPEGRLKDYERYRMLIHHHHHLFKKNCKKSFYNYYAHYVSIVGVILQMLLLRRSFAGFRGTLRGTMELLQNKKVMPL